MIHQLLKLYTKIHLLIARDDGQDMVEYALVVALIAFGVIGAMNSVGTDISQIYSALSSTLAQAN